ncbi:substrate-binding domain-containing protein [Synoicihabitans lomoniglobus]|uniref:Substrate-binding domain-containing protein n=1 Tax=Synoicihabitans lomoniglobus TaxID=2909285 RepID=A0AAF0CP46_9BACT|nr:substrate-binding domain-containing protein [Opitutaceae bacterium LMO-M01]WED63364.1 substrate-binding domain-containing protein [Opitutaceae bacterium LMO-M01]
MRSFRALLLFVSASLGFAAGEKIAVIPKGTTHSFWKSVEAGARQAGVEVDAQIIWKGPLKEDDRAQQIAVVQQFSTDDTDAIVLAPLDDTALRAPARSAMQRGKPVVIFDSALKGEAGTEFISFVATNNHRGGQLGGEELARLINGKGKVVLLRYAEGSASTMAREAGFLAVMARHPGIEIIVDNRYAGPTISTAQDAAMNLLDKLREADAIFTPNESSTQGMLLALRQTGLTRKKILVGFDTSPFLLAALKRGDVKALVAQNPTRMGYLGVKTAVAHLRGEPIETAVDTGCVLVTKTNLDTPEVKAVLGN